MGDTIRLVAPEVDRLVWFVNGATRREHGATLRRHADDLGLDTLDPLPNLDDFLLADRLTPMVATTRMRYMPPGRVGGLLDTLHSRGLVTVSDGELSAADGLRALLEAMRGSKQQAAAAAWADHATAVETVAGLADRIVAAATDEHVVAVVHRDLPRPPQRELRLYDRLVTLRYIRQHDHALAWSTWALSVPEVVALTDLWLDQPPAEEGLAALVDRGLATEDGEITTEGRRLRDAIEDDTNRRNEQSFDVLDDDEQVLLLDGLRELPGTPDDG